ncbi:CDP-diacylglycerol--glycerol-3-phosphate 3-phosphatidyltransferase [Meridianimarinicoccus sp. RP-17]|uniref:CDP-diacylglycerol--glycerol-3-phosphate 3-phosphatidyltransferase n=1 Tax=Meridianimarinicoccus zhengii TaxID=2056810 RepID=UPI000DAE313E|nr:CDP-diacylglycerol--glycerol-3-phosphate 3-phosphatidyltransferase [Phycocomes zhengii]
MIWNLPNVLTVLRLASAPALALVFVVLPRPLSDWAALALFVGAAITDWCDGYLARRWNQTSRFGAMLDPIADKAMVITALALLLALFRLDPWLLVPATVILFREVFVSGLREFLGPDAHRLKVTPLAKWKTTAQMVAITLLFLSLALGGQDDALPGQAARATGVLGLALFWIAAVLTAITGWDYFRKSLPFLAEPRP